MQSYTIKVIAFNSFQSVFEVKKSYHYHHFFTKKVFFYFRYVCLFPLHLYVLYIGQIHNCVCLSLPLYEKQSNNNLYIWVVHWSYFKSYGMLQYWFWLYLFLHTSSKTGMRIFRFKPEFMFFLDQNLRYFIYFQPLFGCFCTISHTFSGFFIIFRFWHECSFSCR